MNALNDCGTAVAGEQQRGCDDRAKILRTRRPRQRCLEVQREFVDPARNAGLGRWRQRRIAPLTAPEIHECLRGIVAIPRRDQSGDTLREPSCLRQLRIFVIQHPEHHRFVQRQAHDTVASALCESQRNQSSIRVTDQVDADVRLDQVAEAIHDEPHLVVQCERRTGCDHRVVTIAA